MKGRKILAGLLGENMPICTFMLVLRVGIHDSQKLTGLTKDRTSWLSLTPVNPGP